MSKCNKCCKSVKDGKDSIACCFCDSLIHIKCLGFSDELLHSLISVKNFKFFCDNCLKPADNLKSLIKVDELSNDVKKVVVCSNEIKVELDNLKKVMSTYNEKCDRVASVGESIGKLKEDMKVTWASVVSKELKKNVDLVSDEVKSVQKTLLAANEKNERENNVVLFNVNESENWSLDNEVVMGILKKVAGDCLKESDVVKIRRQGKKDTDKIRPIVVSLNNSMIKSVIMSNLIKLRSLESSLSKVSISHDLTREQRSDLNKLLVEAKELGSNNSDFLFRVRGQVGKWKIIKIAKKVVA